MAKRIKDEFTRDWIIEQSIDVLSNYENGILTIRALHYQLVSHDKHVTALQTCCRRNGGCPVGRSG